MEICCEPPNDRLDKFKGKLVYEDNMYSLDNENVILRVSLHEAKYNLGKVKTKPMLRCCLGYLGGLPGRLQGHCHVLWLELLFRLLASLPSLPPIFWCKYIYSTHWFLSVMC